jgi:hypothetical protein
MTKPRQSAFDEMESVVRLCSAAMFGAATSGSVPPRKGSRRDRSPELLSFIDFVGPRVSGTLLLCQDPTDLGGTHPRGAGGLGEADVLDWANERVNQLAGRVANRLNPRGISIQIGLPATVHGPSAAPAYDRAAFTRVYGAGSVVVCLRARVHDWSVDAGEADDADDQPRSQYVSEGAILLF